MNKRIDINLGVTLTAVGVVVYNLIDCVITAPWMEVYNFLAPHSRWILLGAAAVWLMVKFSIWEDEMMRELYPDNMTRLAKRFEVIFKDKEEK
jgi:hypothetical protein